ncbi:hypothetical protein STRTUCAR8_02017 [Streptomyces turgidiscabies Car8]|uniref:Uncharacterized protein n=1 Tax=Streptomyces turgidiscabies (strain Car8) TaxID=698760 RepID=L7F5A5_STRT8|nr:hypothetical protein STRTUCAR8_02017 [Streptomyces turgidiscabies Car8]
MVDHLGEVDHLTLGVLPGHFEDLLGRAAEPVHHAERGEAVPGELEHHVVQQAVLGAGAHGHVVDRARHQEPQCVHDMDEVVEDHRAGFLGQSDAVLLHQDQLARVVGALGVPGCEAPVEPDGERDTALLRQPHQPLRLGEFVRERLVDVRRYARLQQPGHDLRMHGGGRVHERRVEALGDQLVEAGVPLPGRQPQAVGDLGECRGCPCVQMQFDLGPRAQHRQIRLPRDVTESDAADLHGVSFSGCLPGSSRKHTAAGGFAGRPSPAENTWWGRSR